MSLEVIILAAGSGTRMCSRLPKVLHTVADQPMLSHVIAAAKSLSPQKIHVVYGHGGEQVRSAIQDESINWVLQSERLGTGHAVKQCLPFVGECQRLLVLYGDVPLIQVATLNDFIHNTAAHHLGVLTANLSDPTGLGRIIRDQTHNIVGIVEEKDANEEQRSISEINTGILLLPTDEARHWLNDLTNENAQGEYYLTDCIALAVAAGVAVEGTESKDPSETLGVNTRSQLEAVERSYQRRLAEALMQAGVSFRDASRFDCRGKLQVGSDVRFDVNVICQGEVTIGNHCDIGPNCILNNVTLGDNVTIKANSLVEDATIGAGCNIGPFARIRPGTELANNVTIGNFVEVKKSTIAEHSKVSHLSYIGDTSIGRNVNIGAGTITCNYDGANKHRTIIEDDVFVGSDTQLVAPVTLGAGSTIGAGTTVTKDTPAGTLTLSRTQQKHITGWRRPTKQPES